MGQRRRQPIDHYSQSQLVRLIRWIESDDLIRTEQELLDETVRELGFQKHGKNIVSAVKAAIQQARR